MYMSGTHIKHRPLFEFSHNVLSCEVTHVERVFSPLSHNWGDQYKHPQEVNMAIKGLSELLSKYRQTTEMTEAQFEDELNKLLPETWKPANVYNELNDKYKLLETQHSNTEKLLKEATEAKNASDEFKAKYEDLLKKQKADTEKFEAELLANRKAYAIDLALTKAGARNNKAVKALLDEEKLAFNDKGELVGISEQLDNIKKDNDYLFGAVEQNETPPTAKPTFGNNTQLNKGGTQTDPNLRKAFGLN